MGSGFRAFDLMCFECRIRSLKFRVEFFSGFLKAFVVGLRRSAVGA